MRPKTPVYFHTRNAEQYFSIVFAFAEPLRNPCRLETILIHVSKTTKVILPQHIKHTTPPELGSLDDCPELSVRIHLHLSGKEILSFITSSLRVTLSFQGNDGPAAKCFIPAGHTAGMLVFLPRIACSADRAHLC